MLRIAPHHEARNCCEATHSDLILRSGPKDRVSKDGGTYRCSAGPMTRSENQVAMPGKKHRITTAIIIRTTNGITPQITSASGMSGAMFLMTKIFSPTGG